jgi:hypothetical protein
MSPACNVDAYLFGVSTISVQVLIKETDQKLTGRYTGFD